MYHSTGVRVTTRKTNCATREKSLILAGFLKEKVLKTPANIGALHFLSWQLHLPKQMGVAARNPYHLPVVTHS
jgi:hypothetical protein